MLLQLGLAWDMDEDKHADTWARTNDKDMHENHGMKCLKNGKRTNDTRHANGGEQHDMGGVYNNSEIVPKTSKRPKACPRNKESEGAQKYL